MANTGIQVPRDGMTGEEKRNILLKRRRKKSPRTQDPWHQGVQANAMDEMGRGGGTIPSTVFSMWNAMPDAGKYYFTILKPVKVDKHYLHKYSIWSHHSKMRQAQQDRDYVLREETVVWNASLEFPWLASVRGSSQTSIFWFQTQCPFCGKCQDMLCTFASDLDLVFQGQKLSPCPISFLDQHSPPPKSHGMASSRTQNNIEWTTRTEGRRETCRWRPTDKIPQVV